MMLITPQLEIKAEDHGVSFDPATRTVTFTGSLRLNGPAEYAPIAQLLLDAMEASDPLLTLNVRQLMLLNSSGINMLSTFFLKARRYPDRQWVIQGSPLIPWQKKSLRNLQRLLPDLTLEFQ
jgi:hypothetical protein